MEQIRDRLPFLVALMAEERKSIPKMGDKSRTFVNKALDMASKNVELVQANKKKSSQENYKGVANPF